jgi:hypothetical protein
MYVVVNMLCSIQVIYIRITWKQLPLIQKMETI